MPRLRSIGLRPEETAFRPSRMIACASTVAVVVPSPASSEVLDATSFTICAPMFSNLSLSSISFATDTPSLVTVGAPKLFSSTALRPLGPSVALTALARTFTPRNMRWRASSLKRTSLAAIVVILAYLPSITAMTSSSRMTTRSSPSTLTSVPLYLPNRILSPTLTSRGRTCRLRESCPCRPRRSFPAPASQPQYRESRCHPERYAPLPGASR